VTQAEPASSQAYGVAELAARNSYGKLLAYLAKRCGNVDIAEDALADAFAAALEYWPRDGVPRVPEAWLLVSARRRITDRARRAQTAVRFHDRLVQAAQDAQHAFEQSDELADDRLGLMFACTHPSIGHEVRAPLILQTVLGLDAARIASAFLVSPAAMAQRLVRAKRKIAAAHIPLRIPDADELAVRLDAVLAAVYAAFAEGWGDPAGLDDAARGLVIEAIWLGRLLARACPDEPEAIGLLALMLHADSRRSARRDAAGAYVPLDEQDPSLWDSEKIDEAESLLARAARARRPGRFQLEAAIQSAHAVRRLGRGVDWGAIVVLYDGLLVLTASPVVALNRAVALGRLHGPRAGLAALANDARLANYQPYWAALAELAARAGDRADAARAYSRAIGLTVDPAVRRYLAARAETQTARDGADT
jgi:RNA polymerase sigma-70 factor (ECF subfamily)